MAHQTKPTGTKETVKETIESIIIALILAFTFRAYVVEAFVIPTGSMAPTLLGKHLRAQCQQCGFHFLTDIPRDSTAANRMGRQITGHLDRDYAAACPMCRFSNTLKRGTAPASGDRILVHKYIYNFSNPRRWDVVVFKNPMDPKINYIKRLVGLPNEEIHLLDGNIYVRSTQNITGNEGDEQTSPWQIARKTSPDSNPNWEAIQRTVWQPIYHSRYIPLDSEHQYPTNRWSAPWKPEPNNNKLWQLEPQQRGYRYTGNDTGVLRFDFQAASDHRIGDIYPYNQHYFASENPRYIEEIEDIRISVIIEPQQRGQELTLATTARLDESDASQPQTLAATIQRDGEIILSATDPSGRQRVLQTRQAKPLPAETSTKIELWYVDQEAIIWINGKPVLRWDYTMSLAELKRRTAPDRVPNISVQIRGGPATIHSIELDRDLYYSAFAATNGGRIQPARGGLQRRPNKPAAGKEPVNLGPNQYFCIGDNGPRSHDGRYWSSVNPWITDRLFDGEKDRQGIVPRDLMMGRAFFVYFPAPYRMRENGISFLPNFGDMRFIY